MRYRGDDKTVAPHKEGPEGLAFDYFPDGQLPELSKPIEAWHPDLFFRKEKAIDGTSHHYL